MSSSSVQSLSWLITMPRVQSLTKNNEIKRPLKPNIEMKWDNVSTGENYYVNGTQIVLEEQNIVYITDKWSVVVLVVVSSPP